MKLRGLTKSLVAVGVLFGATAMAQDGSVAATKEIKKNSWMNGTSFKIDTRYEANVNVGETKGDRQQFTMRPKFYTEILNNSLTLQLRTNIALDSGPKLKQPVPEAWVYKTFKFLDESVTLVPIVRAVVPLNGDTVKGSLNIEALAEGKLEMTNATVKPFFWTFTGMTAFGGSEERTVKVADNQQKAVDGDFKTTDRKLSVNPDAYTGLSLNELGVTVSPAAVEGLDIGILAMVEATRGNDQMVVTDSEQVLVKGETEWSWSTKPTFRVGYTINDNWMIESEVSHSFDKFTSNSNQDGDFNSFSRVVYTFY